MSTTTSRPHHRAPVTVDLRGATGDPLEELHAAYERRWRLVADAAPAVELARSAAEVRDLELRCHPRPRRLPHRAGPDPATFLG